ncbi:MULTISPECIES: lysophospholipid acyltransferase family protein [unclassified Brucella]|uniref:lysophospholipid acyltransferase family protein n=1 Tax=unclassified Brucella TaxID=2632610 RepID=UPI00217D6B4A|nr:MULTISPECIES: lysophospholipid acyltransferase family protein [unclassified Brucella]UWF66943.1 lysophospholipid acyltransferase family protein [Brucella sp. 1315]UWF70069.1 lysophospholipid acyltransferase family protein [Brucella sp. 2594]
MSLKKIVKSPVAIKFITSVGTAYLRFVWWSSRNMADRNETNPLAQAGPCIVAMWHGQMFLAAFARPPEKKFVAAVSKSRDGELVAQMLGKLGIRAIRGSGAGQRKGNRQGGAAALRQMLYALRNGESIVMAAETNKKVFRCGEGVIALARLSGCPIYPASARTSFTRTLNSWDRAELPMPFGRRSVVIGEPIFVPRDASDEELEQYRLQVEQVINQAYASAKLACS